MAIGFLVVDNSGPAAAESESAASVMRQLRRPNRVMFTADVAVDGHNEIAQDLSCMLEHSKGTFCRVVDFRIITTAPAVGLSRVPQISTRNYVTYHMVLHACFWVHEPEKQKKIPRLVLV